MYKAFRLGKLEGFVYVMQSLFYGAWFDAY